MTKGNCCVRKSPVFAGVNVLCLYLGWISELSVPSLDEWLTSTHRETPKNVKILLWGRELSAVSQQQTLPTHVNTSPIFIRLFIRWSDASACDRLGWSPRLCFWRHKCHKAFAVWKRRRLRQQYGWIFRCYMLVGPSEDRSPALFIVSLFLVCVCNR